MVGQMFSLSDLVFRPELYDQGLARSTAPAFTGSAITKNEDSYTLTQELPGISERDIEITAEGQSLKIFAETESESYTRSYRKSFTLPEDVDPRKISAEYRDGMLVVALPMREELQPKKIKVNIN